MARHGCRPSSLASTPHPAAAPRDLAGTPARTRCRRCADPALRRARTARLSRVRHPGLRLRPCPLRRMAETAAHLVEHVFPQVPVRQWVITSPGDCATSCNAPPGSRCGAVSFVQRFGSALNAHTHLHCCVTDGVFSLDAVGTLRFHPAVDLAEAAISAVQQATFVRRAPLDCPRQPLLSRCRRLRRTLPAPSSPHAGSHLPPAHPQDSRPHARPLTEMSVWTSYPSRL